MSSVSDFSSIPLQFSIRSQNQPSVNFYLERDYLFSLDPQIIEPLTQDPYQNLIASYQTQGKNAIIAVVKGRDTENSITIYKFFYEAYLLNKMLFKKQGRSLISRHDPDHPFHVKNPITMLPIIGEVQYFTVSREEQGFKAQFIGTDYTYAHNESLRALFQANCIDQETLKFAEVTSGYGDLSRILDFDVNTLELFSRIVDNQRENLLAQVRVPFKTSFFFGLSFILTLLCALSNVIIAAWKFIDSHQSRLNEFTVFQLILALLLPVVSVSQDLFTAKVFRSLENQSIWIAKIFTWVVFTVMVCSAFGSSDSTVYLIASAMHLGFSFFYLCFSACLFGAFASHKKLI